LFEAIAQHAGALKKLGAGGIGGIVVAAKFQRYWISCAGALLGDVPPAVALPAAAAPAEALP
jgi:hypothetical protein